jgi:hypothetical protein
MGELGLGSPFPSMTTSQKVAMLTSVIQRVAHTAASSLLYSQFEEALRVFAKTSRMMCVTKPRMRLHAPCAEHLTKPLF